MHALFGQALDHLQAELAQLDAGPRQIRIGLDQSGNVAGGWIAIHAQQQVRPRKIEEAQRVRLHELRAMHDFAQQLAPPSECAPP